MPIIVHRQEIAATDEEGAGWRSLRLVRDELADELDADIRLNVLAPGARTPLHYHTGAEHYIFIVAGEADFIVEEASHPVKKGYFITVDPGERHSLTNAGQEMLEFLEFIVPGSGQTTVVEEQADA